jgi:hypothetical protein
MFFWWKNKGEKKTKLKTTKKYFFCANTTVNPFEEKIPYWKKHKLLN